MKGLDKILLYGRTVKNLKFIQIKGQVERRLKRNKKPEKCQLNSAILPVKAFIPELDEDERYIGRFSVDRLLSDDVELLHEKHSLTDVWNEPSASHLWNFNLHYLEFTIPLAVRYKQSGDEKYKDKWMEIIASWIENGSKQADAWEAYTISLRLVNILIGVELVGKIDTEFQKQIYESIYNQYIWLSKNLETSLLANHYFENLKALVIGAVVFQGRENYHKFWRLFLQQIDEQILLDGLHYERSPMYHKIILEDVLRVYTVLKNVHPLDAKKLEPTIKIMTEALKGFENGFATIPLFNDSGNNVSKETETLLKTAERIVGEITPRTEFRESGYYRIDNENITILFDCGDIGPSYMGGHGHNDCLSFELAVEGRKVFSNSGTGQYQGEHRAFFRSTYAHNTVMVDDHEQNELWDEHRVGRRASEFKIHRADNSLTGWYRTYTGERCKRKLLWNGRKLIISDEVYADGEHIARQFFHLAPKLIYKRDGNTVSVTDGKKNVAVIMIPRTSDYLIHTDGEITNYSADFGFYEQKQVLEIRSAFKDNGRIRVEMKING